MTLSDECIDVFHENTLKSVREIRDHAATRIFSSFDGHDFEDVFNNMLLPALKEAFEVGYTVGQSTDYTGMFDGRR